MHLIHSIIDCWQENAVSVRLNNGAISTIDSLRQKGYKIGIVADLIGHMYRNELGKRDILGKIDSLIISSETGIRKPSSQAFHLCLQELECRPEKAVFVGNDPVDDISGAKKAGLKTIFLRTNFHHECAMADFTVDSLVEVPNIIETLRTNMDANDDPAKVEQILIENITKSLQEVKGILVFGSFVNRELNPGSDIDVLVVSGSFSKEDADRVASFQSSFNQNSAHPLSIHIFHEDSLEFWNNGRNVLRYLAIERNSRLIYGQIRWPSIPSAEIIIEALKMEVWEIRRLFAYNSCNINPCGRVFNSHDIINFNPSWVSDYLASHHLKLLKQILSSVRLVENYKNLSSTHFLRHSLYD